MEQYQWVKISDCEVDFLTIFDHVKSLVLFKQFC